MLEYDQRNIPSEGKLMQKLVSVNIAAYNCEATIVECIESVLAQTYTNLEILVLDDYSTDQTLRLVQEKFEDEEKLIILKNEENLGISQTQNKLRQKSSGELIAIIDSDDICLPERIEKQVSFLEGHPEISLLGTNIKVLEDQKVHSQNFMPLKTDHDSIAKQLRYLTAIFHPTLMIRSQVKTLISYDPRFQAAVDYDYYLKALEAGFKFSNLPEELVIYRIHDQAIGTRKRITQLLSAYYANKLHMERVSSQKEISLLSKNIEDQVTKKSDKLFLKYSFKRSPSFYDKILRFIISPFSRIGRFFLKRKAYTYLS
jgi:glycosyltransferase involved in cell wall biosynthesis